MPFFALLMRSLSLESDEIPCIFPDNREFRGFQETGSLETASSRAKSGANSLRNFDRPFEDDCRLAVKVSRPTGY